MLNLLSIRTFLSAAAISTLLGATPAIAETYAVVINAENTFSGDETAMKEQIKRLYLKEQSSWPGGVEAVPFGREADSAEQSAFVKSVLNMSGSEVVGHWLKLKQVRGETPPRGVGSARILARQIGKQPGAFGIVLASEAGAIANSKVLFEFSSD
ncbi:MAG: hypothetical protein JKX99_07765 [Robiginitomaculum sp.]|nr:hypothetical protein [Robiginitomaculum sp.]